MRPMVFAPRPLPAATAAALRRRLRVAHEVRPLSTADARDTVRRVAGIALDLGLSATVFRGGLELRGTEVDHVWLDVEGRVVDAAFPLFSWRFVAVLREFVAGDASAEDLEAAAASAGVEERVLGLFPDRMRYLGLPIWSERHRN